MDMEARSSSGDGTREMLTKIKEYRADLGKLKDEARALSSNAAAAADRAELGLGDDYLTTSAGQRERLLKTTDRMQMTSDRIKQGRTQLLETEVRLLFLFRCKQQYDTGAGRQHFARPALPATDHFAGAGHLARG